MDVLISDIPARARLLVHEATRWVGTREIGGNNRGQCVRMFQKAVDGVASGEPWCLAFVQFCCNQADGSFDAMLGTCNKPHLLFKTEHCMNLWDNMPEECKQGHPEAGTVAIWNKRGTRQGHTGIVSSVLSMNEFFTIEGNTSGKKSVDREGDGVFEKIRTMKDIGSMTLVGFLRPWE